MFSVGNIDLGSGVLSMWPEKMSSAPSASPAVFFVQCRESTVEDAEQHAAAHRISSTLHYLWIVGVALGSCALEGTSHSSTAGCSR